MRSILAAILLAIPATPSHAEFIISNAILEFNSESPRQQDIELISKSKENDYVELSVDEVLNPGAVNETRQTIEDPTSSALLVTLDKTVLSGGSRKLVRFVLMTEPDDREHIYRVVIRPVIKGVESQSQVGLKILVGYETLVIVRPAVPAPSYTAQRSGKQLVVSNNGNTNILFQHGRQCRSEADCVQPPATRVYAGQTTTIPLEIDGPVSYSIWDGKATTEAQF